MATKFLYRITELGLSLRKSFRNSDGKQLNLGKTPSEVPKVAARNVVDRLRFVHATLQATEGSG